MIGADFSMKEKIGIWPCILWRSSYFEWNLNNMDAYTHNESIGNTIARPAPQRMGSLQFLARWVIFSHDIGGLITGKANPQQQLAKQQKPKRQNTWKTQPTDHGGLRELPQAACFSPIRWLLMDSLPSN